MKYFVFAVFILIFWAVVIEPNILVIKKITVENKELSGLKVVFASDFHIKPYETYRLRRIINAINKQNPDIILLGGDYVNGHKPGFTLTPDKIANEFTKLKSHYGTYAILGNHDCWQCKFLVMKEFASHGIIVLENENRNLDKLTVAGVDDMQTGHPNVKKALAGARKPVILLTHSPDVFPDVPKNVVLTLAGHTHGGQIVPPNGKPIVVPSVYGTRYAYGFKKENDKLIFISKGLGSSTIPARFNCFPEILVINFK